MSAALQVLRGAGAECAPARPPGRQAHHEGKIACRHDRGNNLPRQHLIL